MIRILLVPEQAAVPVDQKGPPTLEQMHEWTGIPRGYFQVVEITCGEKHEPAQIWMDEEGKYRDPCIINKFATTLYHGWMARHKIPLDDVIVGNCVLLTAEHLCD